MLREYRGMSAFLFWYRKRVWLSKSWPWFPDLHVKKWHLFKQHENHGITESDRQWIQWDSERRGMIFSRQGAVEEQLLPGMTWGWTRNFLYDLPCSVSTMYKIETFLKAVAKSYYQLNRNYPGQNYQVSQMQIVAIC